MIDWALMNQMVYEGKASEVRTMVQQALDEAASPHTILREGLIGGMLVVGEDFKHNRLYVPEVLIASRAMKAGVALLRPLMAEQNEQMPALATVVIGTIQGDLHDMGKNLVCMTAEGAGFRIVDLGVDVAPQTFVAAVREHQAAIVAVSALLTTTMRGMKDVVEAFKKEGLNQVKICIGGAPVSQMFADEIGADGYAADAGSAPQLFKSMLNGKAAG